MNVKKLFHLLAISAPSLETESTAVAGCKRSTGSKRENGERRKGPFILFSNFFLLLTLSITLVSQNLKNIKLRKAQACDIRTFSIAAFCQDCCYSSFLQKSLSHCFPCLGLPGHFCFLNLSLPKVPSDRCFSCASRPIFSRNRLKEFYTNIFESLVSLINYHILESSQLIWYFLVYYPL